MLKRGLGKVLAPCAITYPARSTAGIRESWLIYRVQDYKLGWLSMYESSFAAQGTARVAFSPRACRVLLSREHAEPHAYRRYLAGWG